MALQDRAHPWPQAVARQLRQWAQDHHGVADHWPAVRWARLRAALPVAACVHLLSIAWSPVPWVSLAVALALGALAAAHHAVQRHSLAPWARHWPAALALVVLGLHALLVAWVPQAPMAMAVWWWATLGVAVVGVWPPWGAATLLGGGALCLSALLGLGLHDPTSLAALRAQAWLAAGTAWALSVGAWRLHTLLVLRERQWHSATQALEERQRDLDRLTRRDGLTGLFNRHTFVKLTEKELARARRLRTSTSVLLIDLDFFKRVNDTHGHPAGDAVLRHVSKLLSESVRSTDLVGRLGGEEFIVLLPATVSGAAQILAEKLRARVQAQVPVWQGTPIPTTLSLGLCSAPPDGAHTFESLYAQADAALYQAKKTGRNRVVVHA